MSEFEEVYMPLETR